MNMKAEQTKIYKKPSVAYFNLAYYLATREIRENLKNSPDNLFEIRTGYFPNASLQLTAISNCWIFWVLNQHAAIAIFHPRSVCLFIYCSYKSSVGSTDRHQILHCIQSRTVVLTLPTELCVYARFVYPYIAMNLNTLNNLGILR
jgi:hypothetical protein